MSESTRRKERGQVSGTMVRVEKKRAACGGNKGVKLLLCEIEWVALLGDVALCWCERCIARGNLTEALPGL